MREGEIIHLRAFASLEESRTKNVYQSIEDALKPFGTLGSRFRPKRYWKIPELFELNLELNPFFPNSDPFEKICLALAFDRDLHVFETGGSWAVWNSKAGSMFVSPEVRWAHLECVQRTAFGSEFS